MYNHQNGFFIFKWGLIVVLHCVLESVQVLLSQENKQFVAWDQIASKLFNCIFF